MALETKFSAAVLNTSLTAGLNQGIQERLAQRLCGQTTDYERVMKFYIYGSLIATPLGYYVTKFANKICQKYASGPYEDKIRLAVNAVVTMPLNSTFFIVLIAKMFGAPLDAALGRVSSMLPPILAHFWQVLLPLQLLPPSLLPPKWKPLVLQAATFFVGVQIKCKIKQGLIPPPPSK